MNIFNQNMLYVTIYNNKPALSEMMTKLEYLPQQFATLKLSSDTVERKRQTNRR